MTTALGIAATTAVIRQLLQNAIPAAQLSAVIGNVDVSALPPDKINVNAETSRLNLFMYQVRSNPGWCNTDLPSHDTSGRRLTNPPLALDLSYMLSAYGSANFHGEILLGYGSLLVHQTRVLTRDAVTAAFSGAALPADLALLAGSGLEGQEEIVSLSMENLTIDEISRLWQVFGEKYRPSITFHAHVVLLRGADAAAASGPPVQRVRLTSTTSISPTIDEIAPATVSAGAGATIDLVGSGLLTPDTIVAFSSGETVFPASTSTDLRVRVALPATLLAGVNTVRLVQRIRFESDLRGGPESNVAAFMLRPAFALQPGTAVPDIVVSGRTDNGPLTTVTITAKLVPAVGKRQSAVLVMNELSSAPGAARHSYSIAAASREQDPNDTTDTIAFAVKSVRRAPYLVRVRIDGAETVVTMSAGTYDAPAVDLT